jgi:hypothetical protein
MRVVLRVAVVIWSFDFASIVLAAERGAPQIAKRVLRADQSGENRLRADAWRPWQKGFDREGPTFVCDNGADAKVQRGASQTVVLDQKTPEPIVAVAFSKAENVGGSADNDYSLYLDLIYADGSHLWGQTAPFRTGTHDWQRRQVVVLPERPVKSVAMHLLLRNHAGKAWFRDAELRVLKTPPGACLFDGVPVAPVGPSRGECQVRDVAAGSDFLRADDGTLGLTFDEGFEEEGGGRSIAVWRTLTVTDTTGKDRAITLISPMAIPNKNLKWLHDPRQSISVEPLREYCYATQFRAGNGRLSPYPLAAVAHEKQGCAIAIDLSEPAFFRLAYNSGTEELYVAYDIGLTHEKPTAKVRFCVFQFDPKWGFRGALARYYKLFPEQFRCRTPEQGLWMPFAPISKVKDWQDFGFKFKEGDNETKWDDEHGMITFRYTEPMTWWMKMPKEMPRTMDAALAEAKRLAEKGDLSAKAFFTSGYHDAAGRFPARMLDTPWSNGAVWSMNSMPGIAGDTTDFKNKWNPAIREKLYGPKRAGDLDGEYIDSSEGYVTDELDFRREHFAAARTPLVFSPDEYRPAIFRGLVAFEYVRGIADDVHEMGKLMMANGAPTHLPWLCPLLEVMGTETDWNPGGKWQPMSDAELLYRRAMCKGKPYCFLMNTRFEQFPPALVEKYMKRSLAYGMFPGFFSHNASQGHYFSRPELYNRDRPLFKKFVPLCKRVAEAGWEPVTLARSSDPRVYVERFGPRYLTVFNDSPDRRTVTLTYEGKSPAASRELVGGKPAEWKDGKTTLTLEGEDVAVIDLL